MITYSIIPRSQLEGALRLDAEYYQPEYLELISKLKTQKSKFLGEISKVAYGITPSGGIFEKSGIPFVRSQNFSNLLIDTSDIVFCTEEFHKQNKKSAIKPGDILFAAVGATIGQVVIVQDEIKEGNINQNIARVRVINKELNPYFVGLFFASRAGQLQIKRLTTGNAQPYLNSKQIKALIVPIFAEAQQKEIAKYFQEIQNQIKVSKLLYSQAENLLLEELGLKDFKLEDDLSYIVNLSQIKPAHRADAEYFQPKYEKLINRIRKFSESLLEVVDNIPARFNPYLRPEETFKYVELEHINTSIGIIDGYIEILGNEAPSRAKRVLKEKDVIFSSVEGSLKKVALVNKEQEGYLASTGFFQFRCKKVLPEYFLVLAKSIVLQMQFEKETAGTILTAVPKEALKNIIIPILPKPTQQKIADLVQKSHEARKKAKELLEEAKQKVEELIEKDK